MRSRAESHATLVRQSLLAGALTTLLVAGCSDDVGVGVVPTVEEPVPGLAISEAQKASPGVAVLATDGTPSGSSVAYVSAAPGTFPTATHVRIGNVTTGVAVTQPVVVVDGGFDPVAIPARPDDRLELAIFRPGGVVAYARVIVPYRRPPTVVRTNPPKGRTDVALSIQPTVIFSEPIDPRALDGAVTLRRGGVILGGNAALEPGSAVTVVFVPDQPLTPLTEYELVVSRGVRDLEGESLEEEHRVTFTTGSADVGHDLQISNLTTGGAFDVDGYGVRITVAGHPPRVEELELNTAVVVQGLPLGEATVELEDVAANCSVTGASSRTITVSGVGETRLDFQIICTPPPELASVRLVFSRWEKQITTGDIFNLWAMNADGTALRQLTTGISSDLSPIVSPDGSRIAFSRDPEGVGFWGSFAIYVMDANGNGLTRLTNDPDTWSTIAWSWSPDGSRIAMQYWGGGRIDVIGVDGTGRRTLVNDGMSGAPVWSPDGRLIAFRRYVRPVGEFSCENPTGGYEIWVMNPDGTNPRFLRRLEQCAAGGHLSWSSDGRILFSEGTPRALWSIKPDGSDAVRVLGPIGPNRWGLDFGAVSPDGKLITLTRTYGREWAVDVYLLNVTDGSLTRVTADGVSMGAAFLR